MNIKQTSGLQLYNKNWLNKHSQDFLSQAENSYFTEHLSIDVFLTKKKNKKQNLIQVKNDQLF